MITDQLRKIACTGPDCHYDRDFIGYAANTFKDAKPYKPERLAVARMHAYGMRLSYLLFEDDESYAGMKAIDATFSGAITVKDTDALLEHIMKDYKGDRLTAITMAITVITARENPPDLEAYNRAFVKNWCSYCSCN